MTKEKLSERLYDQLLSIEAELRVCERARDYHMARGNFYLSAGYDGRIFSMDSVLHDLTSLLVDSFGTQKAGKRRKVQRIKRK